VPEPLAVLREPRVEPEKQVRRPQVSLRKVECPSSDGRGQVVPRVAGLPAGLKVLRAE
jgi:hypothetical protein